jgi:gamma-glutamylcyclotransferase (GGCT)/AIG2-like uncharacterized protein YtfP
VSGALSQARLFVYGTLLTAANHPLGDLLRQQAELIGDGSICARLFVIGEAFPGAVPSKRTNDRVHGELYALAGDPAPLLKILDAYENCSPDFPKPHEFARAEVSVTLEDGTAQSALAYLYAWDVAGARLLPSGRFIVSGPPAVRRLRLSD